MIGGWHWEYLNGARSSRTAASRRRAAPTGAGDRLPHDLTGSTRRRRTSYGRDGENVTASKAAWSSRWRAGAASASRDAAPGARWPYGGGQNLLAAHG
jgi:hypothetical protein